MKSPLSRAALIAGAALSLTFAGASFAHPAPGAPPPAMTRHDPAEHAQKLRDKLQLRADQEPALQALIATMKDHEGPEAMGKRHEEMKGLTTPQRLDRMAAMMAEHQQRFAEHATAVKRFYAQLTPSQQKAFDALHDGMGKGMHGKRGGHGGGMRGWGG